MHIASAFVAVATAVGLGLTAPFAAADTGAPHEKTISAEGFTFTVGHKDNAVHPVAPMNGMPTSREVYLDNTSYGRFDGPGTGKIRTGYFVACAVDLDVSFSVNAGAGLDAGATAGVDVGDVVTPSAGVSIGPSVNAGIDTALTITPGTITDVRVAEKTLTPGRTGYIVSRDFQVRVNDCGGPLTVQAYTVIEASSPQVDGGDWVMGDPVVM
ncbi:MspA family porin [Nocardia macrotermitis]|uniref:MspA protein n=1 Tax=Nocardia macrotermitis TaxID=2585198 RepID=A0A7K0D006_9NOCA|nr:MspA family porin [Nocardia macrotermitis]MQY19001.1 hypothetical protein [Nocardia macrotermitis]